MAKKLISYDDTKPGLGLPDVVEGKLSETYALKGEVPTGVVKSVNGAEPDDTGALTISTGNPDVITSPQISRIVATTDPNRLPLPGEFVIEYEPPFRAVEDFTDGIGGWSPTWVDRGRWEAADDATATDGKIARHSTTLQGRYALMWDTVGLGEDVEILIRSQYTGSTANSAGVVLRGSGAAGSETGYVSMLFQSGYAMAKFANGEYTSLGSSDAAGLTVGEWVWQRFRAQGDRISTKVWSDGQIEPLDWSVTRTDTSLPGEGFIGLVTTAGDSRWDVVAIAFDGARAELP